LTLRRRSRSTGSGPRQIVSPAASRTSKSAGGCSGCRAGHVRLALALCAGPRPGGLRRRTGPARGRPNAPGPSQADSDRVFAAQRPAGSHALLRTGPAYGRGDRHRPRVLANCPSRFLAPARPATSPGARAEVTASHGRCCALSPPSSATGAFMKLVCPSLISPPVSLSWASERKCWSSEGVVG
jgi:hypothetical protein